MKNFVTIFVATLTSLTVSATNSPPAKKVIHGHTVGKPTWKNDIWLWAHETESEFFEKTGAISKGIKLYKAPYQIA